jgi:hypothetical protein
MPRFGDLSSYLELYFVIPTLPVNDFVTQMDVKVLWPLQNIITLGTS